VIEAAQWRAEVDPLNHRVAAEVIDQLAWTAIIWTDEKGVITGWNAGAERLFGYRRADVIGKERREFFRPQDRIIGLPEEQLAIANRQGGFSDTGWRVKSDGSAVRVHSSMKRLAPDGATRGFVEEVTADNETLSRQRAEASLNEHRLQIRKKVNEAEERAAEYQRQLASLSTALREETERRRFAEEELARFRAHALPLIEFEVPLEPGIDVTRHGATQINEDAVTWSERGATPVTEMILEATSGGRSGVLLLRSDVHRSEIYFEHGRIAATTSDDPRSRLGEWMVRRGLITEDERKQALEMCEFGEISFGRSLLTLKVLTKEEILAAMGEKIESDVERCRRMDVKRWAFVGSATTRTLVPIGVDPREMRAMQTVVALPDETRYHRSTCSLISQTDGPPLLLSESAANERGLAPCRRCMVA
jgi:PAS domain S-box-containing protein